MQVCAALLLGLAPTTWANTVVFATGAQMLSGYTENASATFDINNTTHTITVHLLNLQFDPLDVHQAIGSVRFTINGAGAPAPSIETASGTVFDINSGGVIKNVAAMTTNVWQTTALPQGSGEQIVLCAVVRNYWPDRWRACCIREICRCQCNSKGPNGHTVDHRQRGFICQRCTGRRGRFAGLGDQRWRHQPLERGDHQCNLRLR